MRRAANRQTPPFGFLSGVGEMGEHIRTHDWASTELGALPIWTQPLRTALSICLQSYLPSAILWGPELRLLYNDAWAPILSGLHPGALGLPARDVWPDTWPALGTQLARVLGTGEGFSTCGQILAIKRGGIVQETCPDYSFMPILDDDDMVAGVFAQGHETVGRPTGDRRMRAEGRAHEALVATQQAVAAAAGDLDTMFEAIVGGALAIFPHADGAVVELVEGDAFVYRAVAGRASAFKGLRIARSGSLSGRCVAEGRPLVAKDAETDERVDRAGCRRIGLRSMVVVPLFRRGEVAGVLKLQSGEPGTFGERDAAVAQLLAGALAAGFAEAAEVDAARALRVERGLLEAVIRQAPVGVSIAAAPDGRSLALNDKAVEILGHRDPGGDGNRYLSYGARHPDGRPYAVDEYPTMRALKRGEVVEAAEIAYCRGGDGPCRRLEFSSSPVRGENGDIVAAVTIITDVEEQRRAEAALRANEAALRANGAALRANEARQAVLLELLREQRETGRPDAMMRAASEAVGRHLGADRVGFFEMRGDDTLEFGISWTDGSLEPLAGAWAAANIGTRYLAEVRQGRTLGIADTARDPLTSDSKFGEIGARAIIGAPIIRNGRWHAGLYVNHSEIRTWTDSDTAFVREIADQTWDAVERARAQAEQRRSEERYRALFDSLDAGFCVVEVKFDEEGNATDYRFVEANPAFETQTGLTNAVGGWMRELAPDHEQHWFDVYGRVALTGEPVRFENAASALGDRWFDVHAFRTDEPGEHRVAILFNDISDRRRAEAALRELNATLEERVAERTAELMESERRFRVIFDSAYQFMALLEPDGTVAEVNQTAMNWSNITPQEIVGGPFWLASPMRDNPALQSRVRDEIGRAAKGEVIRSVHEMRGSGEARAIVDFSVKPVIGKAGRVTHVIAEGRDITELKRTQEQLRQSQKLEAVGRLTGGVAHDFNNLLMVVLANLEILRKRLPDADPSTARLVDAAMQGAQRGAALTGRLLAFARKQDLKPEPVNVPDLVKGMTDLLKQSLGPQVTVEARFTPDLPKAMVDANQLELAILNLAVNARDAMPDGGILVFAAEEMRVGDLDPLPRGSYVRLSVTDTGTGMDEATLGRAMEPFFTTKGVGKGTGLGLSMIHGLAEQSGGRFTLFSEPGRGTTAEILLPVAATEAEAARFCPAARRDGTSRLAVLVVDDDALVLMGTVDMIEYLGHEAIEAGSGPEALAIVRDGRSIDVMVTDQAMPGMTGIQLAEAVKAERPGLPIVLVTGYSELPESCDGLVTRRLGKPFRQAELATVLAEAADIAAGRAATSP